MTKRVVDVYPSGLSKRLKGISHWNNAGFDPQQWETFFCVKKLIEIKQFKSSKSKFKGSKDNPLQRERVEVVLSLSGPTYVSI